jgi:hypothetical protein
MPNALARRPVTHRIHSSPADGRILPPWPYLVDSFEESALISGLRVVRPSFARGSRCATVTRL